MTEKTYIELLKDIKKALASKETMERFIEYIKETPMTPKERNVLIYRMGLEDATPKTLEETGKMFGLTRERIRQIESKGIAKMRAYFGFNDDTELSTIDKELTQE